MGNIKHHAIAVTTYKREYAETARNRALSIFSYMTSEILESELNGYCTFFVAPDGSKEDWEDSNARDVQRFEFIQWIKQQAFEDGSNPYSFCEFFYGDTEKNESKIVTHN